MSKDSGVERGFEMAEVVSRDQLRRHPAWAPYRGEVDRERILGWGVGAAALEREIARFEFCGTEPLYPLLAPDPLPAGPGVVLGATFTCADGAALEGYLVEPHAFGVFVGERELCFNRTLPALAARSARELAAALGRSDDEIFPLRYATAFSRADGRRVEGSVDPRPGKGSPA